MALPPTVIFWTPEKRELLDVLSAEFLSRFWLGRTLIAVDGVDGAGTVKFADAFAERLGKDGHPVFRASIDGFHRPREERYLRGRESAEGLYVDSFDYDLFRRVLIEPFRLGGSAGFVTAAWDVARDIPVEMAWRSGPQDATLIVDGIFLGRPELSGLWNWRIWLEVSAEIADARLDAAQSLYLADADPRATATAIIDTTDPDRPMRASPEGG